LAHQPDYYLFEQLAHFSHLSGLLYPICIASQCPQLSHLPSPPFMPTRSPPPQCNHCIAGSQMNLMLVKGFVHEVLPQSRMSRSVLQATLCHLEAICAKVPEHIEKEKIGEGAQGGADLSGNIVQGDLEAEEWKELSLDSVMADFVHMDAAVEVDTAKADAKATVKVVDSNDAPQSASSFMSQLLLSNSVNGLKLHLMQNLIKKPKVPLLVPLPLLLLCPCTFLTSLTLPLKFAQGQCYSNKAWAKLSRLPPCEIGCYECTLGDALKCPWVGKTPVVSLSSNRNMVTVQNGNGNIVGFSTPPPCHLSPNLKGTGLR
jgi:PHO85 cyclin-5